MLPGYCRRRLRGLIQFVNRPIEPPAMMPPRLRRLLESLFQVRFEDRLRVVRTDSAFFQVIQRLADVLLVFLRLSIFSGLFLDRVRSLGRISR